MAAALPSRIRAHVRATPRSVDLGDLANDGSELRGAIERGTRFDRNTMMSSSPPSASVVRDERCANSTRDGCKSSKNSISTGSLKGSVDYLLFKNYLAHQLRQLDLRSEGAGTGGSPCPSRIDSRPACCAAGSQIDGMAESGRLAR